MVLSDKLCIALTKIYCFFFLLSPETPHTFNRINSFSYLLCDYYRTHGFVLFNRLIFNTLNYKFSLATEFKKKKSFQRSTFSCNDYHGNTIAVAAVPYFYSPKIDLNFIQNHIHSLNVLMSNIKSLFC